MRLNEANTRFALANAQAIQHIFRYWITQARTIPLERNPANPSGGYLCGSGGEVDIVYHDVDGNMFISQGDEIIAESPSCLWSSIGGGRTQITVMKAYRSQIIEARVRAEGTVDAWSLEAYGWSQKMNGTMRFIFSGPDTTLVFGEGEIKLDLHDGHTLLLRNLALRYRADSDSISGQFDLVFSTGREAGRSIQVDTLGELAARGSTAGPTPGALQLSGLDGTKARLEGRYDNDLGDRFKTFVDFNGTGQLSELDDVGDQVFYSWFIQ